MSDNKKSLSDNKKALSEEKLSMAENSTQMNEIDKQLAQWQSAYKDATPSVDTDALIKETKSARFKLKLKGAVDLVLGLAVSVWCLTLVLFEPLSTYQFLLFMVLTPIPAAFGAWGYWVRQKQWKVQALDVQSMLAFKQNQLKQQLYQRSAINKHIGISLFSQSHKYDLLGASGHYCCSPSPQKGTP